VHLHTEISKDWIEFVETDKKISEKRTKRLKVALSHCKQRKATMEEEVQALVIDNGSGMCKAGE